MQEKDISDKVFTGSGATELEAEPEIEVFKFAEKQYFAILDYSFSHLEDRCDLETGSVLSENVNLVLASSPCSNRRARGQ